MREKLVGSLNHLHQEMVAHGVAAGEAAHVTHHEALHAQADTEGHGVFGLILVPAIIEFHRLIDETIHIVTQQIEVVAAAFYQVLGPRSPETMLEIAENPPDPSSQDQRIAAKARAEIAAKQKAKKPPFQPGDSGVIFTPHSLPLAA